MFRSNRLQRAVALAAACGVCTFSQSAAAVDVLHQQVFDWANGLRSERQTGIPFALTADDVHFATPAILDSFTATFIVDRRIEMIDWELVFHANRGGKPAEVLAIFPRGEAVDTGLDWDAVHNPSLGIFRITWDLERVEIFAGRYWLVARGVGQNQAIQRAYWGTANTQFTKWREAHHVAPIFGVHDWTRWSDLPSSLLLDQDPEFHGAEFDTAWVMRGFEAEHAELREAIVLKGTPILTHLFRLLDLDDIFFVTSSTSDNNPNSVNLMKTKIIGWSTFPDPTRMRVTVFAHNSRAGGRIAIFLRNWQTDSFEHIRTFGIGTEKEKFRIDHIDPARYVKDNGRVALIIKVFLDERPNDAPFVTWIDQVKVRVW